MRVTLSLKERFLLTKMVEEGYVKSGLSDEAFAGLAATTISPKINRKHVWSARDSLGLPGNQATRPRASATLDLIAGLEARIFVLEGQFGRLDDRLEVYIKGCRGDHVGRKI